MLQFREFLEKQIHEKVLSPGFNPSHESHREKHRKEIHNILHTQYKQIGGYGGLGSGTKEESDAIHHDISNSNIKMTKRDGKVSQVNLYKDIHGRKSIASGTDGSDQGKKDFMKNKIDDHLQKRAWGEISGKMSHIHAKIGTPDIPSSRAKELLNKDVSHHQDGVHYDRTIGGHMHTKKMVGHPKK